MLKQSICYPLFHDVAESPAAFCELIASIGYRGIDLWDAGPIDELIAPARACGLTLTGFIGHASIESGLNNPQRHDDIVASLRDSIDLAARHEVPTVIAFAGNRLPGQSDIEGLIQCARGLRRVAPYGERHGVTVCLELLNSKIEHPEYLADHADYGVAICEMVDSPAVKLLFDIYHVQVMEGGVLERLMQSLDRVGHIHTAGVPGRHDLDEHQVVPYPRIAEELRLAGYDGFVGHEFWAKADKAQAMRAAFETCRRSLSAVVKPGVVKSVSKKNQRPAAV